MAVSLEQLERVKASLERPGDRLQDYGDSRHPSSYDSLICSCIRLDEVLRGRLLCSFTVLPHLLVCSLSLPSLLSTFLRTNKWCFFSVFVEHRQVPPRGSHRFAGRHCRIGRHFDHWGPNYWCQP